VPTSTQSGFVARLVAVAGGKVSLTAAGDTLWTSTARGPGVADPPLNTSGLVFSSGLGRRLFFADGTHHRYLDFNDNTVYAWSATTAGTLPVDNGSNKHRLICTWRGRIGISGFPAEPQLYAFSRQLDPFDWDYQPTSVSPTQAFAGATGFFAQPDDVVTALIPYTDDLLLMGCDRSLWRITGDPADGGQLDLVTRGVGVVWGVGYAMEPGGAVWFMSNSCDIYRYVPGGVPVPMSNPIRKLLGQVDLSQTTVRMEWSVPRDGLHLFLTRLDGATTVTHYFWERRTGAWWPDRLGGTGMDPLSTCTFDATEPGDRVTLLGGWDGYVRALDPASTDDDGTAIDSYVLVGPILSKLADDMLVSELQAVIGSGSGTVTYQVLVGETPEAALAASPVTSGTLTAGRSPTMPIRRAGHACYVKLSATTPWAYEQIRLAVRQTGMVRRRTKY
jgi:hypothetical protein